MVSEEVGGDSGRRRPGLRVQRADNPKADHAPTFTLNHARGRSKRAQSVLDGGSGPHQQGTRNLYEQMTDSQAPMGKITLKSAFLDAKAPETEPDHAFECPRPQR